LPAVQRGPLLTVLIQKLGGGEEHRAGQAGFTELDRRDSASTSMAIQSGRSVVGRRASTLTRGVRSALLEPDELAEEPPIQRLRRPFTRTLQTAIDTGLARLKAEAERRATP
jgi:hypothetical protein